MSPTCPLEHKEKYLSRSLKIRLLILKYLRENEGRTWTSEMDLYACAGLYASCSSVMAARWVLHWTRVDGPMEIVPMVGHGVRMRCARGRVMQR